ncbi:hypothetical protein GCM10022415_14350 [Knoellia locipacati]|uniref:Uncharacterized protein n=1 Tax=Knoellia locipacati TaxID=882824 RepID=A0A512SZK1_9MICO|nr:hypothetical protein [Knoellia locipacati]GEQ13386.1 hypothetical protein KLO01_14330 [Knoellia locipacati]
MVDDAQVDADRVLDAFGARWTLDTSALVPAARERLDRLWARCRVPGVDGSAAGVEPFVVTDPDPYAVSRAITLASLRRRRGTAVLLHAAGLESRGRAVALVGPSGAGKSTAALVLGRELGYLSDETVAVEPDGIVSPYPKPVSVVTDPGAPWDKHEEGPDALGLREVGGTAYLQAVVVLERDPVREVPELAPLPLVDAAIAVIAQSSSLTLLDRPLHRLAELLSRSDGPYVLRYGEIAHCVDLVRDLLEDRERPPREPWTTTPGSTTHADTHAPRPAGTLTRAPWHDALHGEGGSVVLVGEDVVRLGPVGEVVWTAAEAGIGVDEAVEAVVAALGEHPDADRLVRERLDELLRTGVLLSR